MTIEIAESYRLHFTDCVVEFAVDTEGSISVNFYNPGETAETDTAPQFSFDEENFELMNAMWQRAKLDLI